MRTATKTIPALAIAGALTALSVSAYAAQTTTVKLTDSPEYGQHLVDGQGNSLYLFEADTQGKSTCYDACAQMWPPLIAAGDVNAGDGIDADKLDTIKRKNGKQQVAYNGHPLYRFAKDSKPGQAKGQDIKGFDAEWYLLTAEGQKAEGDD